MTTREYLVGGASPTWLSGDGTVDFPTAIPFVTVGPVLVSDDGWHTVIGHFGDAGCVAESDPIAVARCRQLFRITGVEAAAAPDSFVAGTWTPIAESPLEGRASAASAWTGTDVMIWGGDTYVDATAAYVADGARYDPEADRWSMLPPAPIAGRANAFGAWTGTEFLIWGGQVRSGDTEGHALDGALFDPATERWRSIPVAPIEADPARSSAVWAGSELVVFASGMAAGAAFSPSSGSWRLIQRPPALGGDHTHPALAWTGSELIALGYPVADVDTSMAWAASWNPVTDAWRELPEPGFLSMHGGPVVWTGTEALVLWEANRAFDPEMASWRSVENSCGASGGSLWTGRYVIQYGTAYDTVTERCRTLPPEPERPGGGYREFAVEVWTGTELIRWSGGNGADGGARANDGVSLQAESLLQP